MFKEWCWQLKPFLDMCEIENVRVRKIKDYDLKECWNDSLCIRGKAFSLEIYKKREKPTEYLTRVLMQFSMLMWKGSVGMFLNDYKSYVEIDTMCPNVEEEQRWYIIEDGGNIRYIETLKEIWDYESKVDNGNY